MAGKHGFSLDEHKQAGEDVGKVLDAVTALSDRIADRYGVRGPVGYHTGHQLQKARTALLLVRQTLKTALEDEYPYDRSDCYK